MKQLPQNLKALLQDIGEDSALLYLAILLAQKRGWKVYRSYTEDSCDIVLRRTHGKPRPGYRKELRIEVKTRQNLVTTRKGSQIQFMLTRAEYNSCQFVIGIWFDRGDYFIFPKSVLKPASAANKHYRISVNRLRNGSYNKIGAKYRNKWELISAKLK